MPSPSPVSLQTIHSITPRHYQEEIFLQAQNGNVIAVLDTGSGKTYIGIMLIKWTAAQECNRGKAIIFIVPKVPLVEQQGNFIAKHTPLRVKQLHGATALDMTNRSGWKSIFDRSDVLVMTAQILLNLLTHSNWSLEKVSLLIIDECHHTRGNNPTNVVMRDFYRHVPREQRPKIFGMTASPTWRTTNPEQSITVLEQNMDAKVITVMHHAIELENHAPKPTEIIHQYPASPETYSEYPLPTIYSRFDWSKIPASVDISWSKIQARYDVAMESLGPLGAELFLYSHLRQRILQLLVPSVSDEMEILRAQLHDDSSISTSTLTYLTKQLVPEMREIYELVEEYAPLFESVDDNPDLPDSWSFSLEWCSPKVRELAEILTSCHTANFQGIVFVEQRHIAACLAKLLSRIPQLRGIVSCAELVGHGGETGDPLLEMQGKRQREIVDAFRQGKINLLIATPVAEEGLDFPACDVVIRFDAIHHMVGYVQSRGRARHKTSTFIVMVQEGQSAELEKYLAFSGKEEEIKKVYQQNGDGRRREEDEDTYIHPDDLFARERYTVPSTGSTLTYDSAISLLNRLCALIPCDPYTPPLIPSFSGDFVSTVRLPSALPLSMEQLIYTGPKKQSKKEAKRAAAFIAVRALHRLDVFDDYLLPARNAKDRRGGADEALTTDVGSVPPIMDVVIRDPWTLGQKMWTHAISLDGRCVVALVTGTDLGSPMELTWDGCVVRTHPPVPVQFDIDDERRQRQLLQEFTKFGLWWYVTSRPIDSPLSCYLVPFSAETNQPDFQAMERILEYPFGNYDWTSVNEEHHHRILFRNRHRHAHMYVLRRIRYDLTPLSRPPEGSFEYGYETYRDFYLEHQRVKVKGSLPEIPLDGPLVEGYRINRQVSGTYHLDSSQLTTKIDSNLNAWGNLPHLVPLSLCTWYNISEDIYRAFALLPRLLHRVSDVWRARCARLELGFPAIENDLLVEAFTIPEANAGFNNQRLETLGDAVLEICTSVHIYNKFPRRHEGQLSNLRQRYISNRYLLSCAKDIGLERYLTSEAQANKTWRYVVTDASQDNAQPQARRFAKRRFARRSLQDCMEASLGASFLTGGIPMALHMGAALGLNFGGTLPWSIRYSRPPESAPLPALFCRLQEVLGYEFHRPELLVEAMTHTSFSSNGTSYQRLEFLGDAVLDLVVIAYLYKKFQHATSHQLALPRTRAVCAPVLASIAVRRLGLHKVLLSNNTELSIAISRYVPILEETSTEEMVLKSWAHDPPKVISDVLESLVAAILIDSAYNFEKTSAVVEELMQDALDALSPDMPPDPVSALLVWAARSGCRRIYLRKSRGRPESKQNDAVCVVVHDTVVAGPMTASKLSVAKAFVCEKACMILQHARSPRCLHQLCDCSLSTSATAKANVKTTYIALDGDDPETFLDDSTEEGFEALAQQTLTDTGGSMPLRTEDPGEPGDDQNSETDILEELEVEQMIHAVREEMP